MHDLRGNTLRERLVLLWLIVFVPFIIIQIAIGYSWIRARYTLSITNNIARAHSVAVAFEGLVHEIARTGEILGIMILEKDRVSPSFAEQLLEIAEQQYVPIQHFVIIDTLGNIVGATDLTLGVIDRLNPFSILQNFSETDAVVIGNLQDSIFGADPGFFIMHTIFTKSNTRRPLGYFLALINPSTFEKHTLSAEIVRPSSISLFDRNGVLVYDSDFPSLPFRQRRDWKKNDPLLKDALQGKVRSGSSSSPLDRQIQINTRIPIREYGWVAGTSRPRIELFRPIYITLLLSSVLTLSVTVLTVLFGRSIIRVILTAIEKLKLHAAALSHGSYSHVTEPSGIADFDALIGSFNQLGTELAERDTRIRKRTDELKRSNEELERFAYVASHDLQEPLRTIAGYLQLIERRYYGRLDTDANEFIEFTVKAAHRLQDIINDLLAFSRIGTHGQPFSPVDTQAIMTEILISMKSTLTEAHAEVAFHNLPTIQADANQVRQLFQNLISNAVKFRRNEPPSITIIAQRQDTRWLFSVADNGIGIQPEYFEKIFLPFKRLHAQDKYPGTGIGLAICKKIVDRHGGKMWVESSPGKGSTFYFTLPQKEPNHGVLTTHHDTY